MHIYHVVYIGCHVFSVAQGILFKIAHPYVLKFIRLERIKYTPLNCTTRIRNYLYFADISCTAFSRTEMEEKYILHYFDAKGRAEQIRILLTMAGVQFEDHRFSYETFLKFIKPSENL